MNVNQYNLEKLKQKIEILQQKLEYVKDKNIQKEDSIQTHNS